MTKAQRERAGPVAALLVLLSSAPSAAQSPRSGIDSLAAEGRLQEAAWLAREAGDTARAGTLLARLEAILRARPRTVAPQGVDSQGVSYTFHLHHDHGVESIFKVGGSDIFCRECGADREVASYAVDRLLELDLTPMTVRTWIRNARGDSLDGSAMYYVHGASLPAEVGIEKPDALRFFDAVLGNSDRHAGNWLVLPDGRVVAIDHNRAFEYRSGSRPVTCWETEIDSIALPAELGRPLERYRALSADSMLRALGGLDPGLAQRFLAMRERVLERIRHRIERPREPLPHTECVPRGRAG